MSNYWKERFKEEEERAFKKAINETERYKIEYDKALKTMTEDIEKWYMRIATNNEISLAEAKKLLSKNQLKEFKWDIDEYIKKGREYGLDGTWRKELENASAKAHITKLEAMKLQIRAELEKLYNNNNEHLTEYLTKAYEDSYYHSTYEILKGQGKLSTSLYKLDTNAIHQIIKSPWVSDGKNFSDRLWEDKQKLIKTLDTQLTQGFIRGDSIAVMTKKLTDTMEVKKHVAERLILTEHSAYTSKARTKVYEDLDVERYEIVATLDSRTSDICQGMDGKVFDLKDYEVGITAPPFHIRCRSTTAPFFDEEVANIRSARDENGKTVYVEGNMTYKDWKEKYVKVKNDENEVTIIEKQYENIIKKEPKITEQMKNIISKTNGHLEGLDFRIKTKESLFRKIEKDYIEQNFKISKIDIFKDTKDILRYTIILESETFVDEYNKIRDLILMENYNILKVKNVWKDGNVYKGINTVVKKNGLMLEIQYHTKESFELKNGILHKLYEEYRGISTPKVRKKELYEQMKKLSLKIKNPKGVEKIRWKNTI